MASDVSSPAGGCAETRCRIEEGACRLFGWWPNCQLSGSYFLHGKLPYCRSLACNPSPDWGRNMCRVVFGTIFSFTVWIFP
jgi:hypothetical protein